MLKMDTRICSLAVEKSQKENPDGSQFLVKFSKNLHKIKNFNNIRMRNSISVYNEKFYQLNAEGKEVV